MFDERHARRDLHRYRRKGPKRTTRMLLDALIAEGIEDASVLDIGGGVGSIPHALLSAGAARATAVDASSAYLRSAREEAERQDHAQEIDFRHGDFVELAPEIARHDVVTLDRAICCYGDMRALVGTSAERTARLYGIVVPRDAWWTRVGVALANVMLRLSGTSFRAFVHSTDAIERMLSQHGLKPVFRAHGFVWHIAVFARRDDASQAGSG